MATKYAPDLEPPAVRSVPQRSGGWWRKMLTRIGLALSGSDEALILENTTQVAWKVYHEYHQLTIIDAGEEYVLHLLKKGTLNMLPIVTETEVEYLVAPLSVRVHHVRIYRRRLADELEVYDLRVS